MILKIFLSVVLILISLLIGCDNGKQQKILITGLITTNYHPVFDIKDVYDTTFSRTTVIVAEYKKGYLQGAIVEISSDDQTVKLTGIMQYNFFTYQDTGNHLTVIPGTIYHLRITVPDGRIFESDTRVPYDPVVFQPMNDDTLVLGQDVFGYETHETYIACHTPYVYQKDNSSWVQLHIKTGYNPPSGAFTYTIENHDSLYAPIYLNGDDFQKRQIDLITLDSSLSKYSWNFAHFPFGSDSLYQELYDYYSSVPLRHASNIRGENVVGCFGSYSRASSTYYLKKP